jgi:hypothetical protein
MVHANFGDGTGYISRKLRRVKDGQNRQNSWF